MVAIMNEALELEPGQKVLEIGAGSGYHAATLAETIGPNGRVYTVERVESLVRFARENLERAGYADPVIIIHGDGSLGYPDRAPYDRIVVTAAAPRVPPKLLEQLKPDGIIVVPIGSRIFGQELVRIRKTDQKITRESLGGVAFVPLIGEHGHES
jgi:protein-L-isoaspartate(D-aspartate) O-methyltransferase